MQQRTFTATGALGAVLVASLLCCGLARPVPAFTKGDNTLRVLSIGDSTTQGSVPSKNLNHPYTIVLSKLLKKAFPGKTIQVENAAVGGAGIFALGFHNPINLVEWTKQTLTSARNQRISYNYVVFMLGINDLLRVGRSANDVLEGLKQLYGMALATGANVVAVPPFAAPGFVSKDDYKEGQRQQLAQMIVQYAIDYNKANPQGPAIIALNLQQQLDFNAMSKSEWEQWLDDGLHWTEVGYDRLGNRIADPLIKIIKASSQQ